MTNAATLLKEAVLNSLEDSSYLAIDGIVKHDKMVESLSEKRRRIELRDANELCLTPIKKESNSSGPSTPATPNKRLAISQLDVVSYYFAGFLLAVSVGNYSIVESNLTGNQNNKFAVSLKIYSIPYGLHHIIVI